MFHIQHTGYTAMKGSKSIQLLLKMQMCYTYWLACFSAIYSPAKKGHKDDESMLKYSSLVHLCNSTKSSLYLFHYQVKNQLSYSWLFSKQTQVNFQTFKFK